jgi:hypothetical protein
MPRNRYTKDVREGERAQIERQIEELAELAESLRRETTEVTATPTADGAKERRNARLAQNQQHRRLRQHGSDTNS